MLVFLHGLGVIGPNATDEPAEAWAARGFRVLAPAEYQADVDAFRRALPDAEIVDYPDSGHNVLLDQPDDAIPAIADWLALHAGRPV